MTFSEIVFGTFLIALLVALAAYYAWRQKATLRLIRGESGLSPEDRVYLLRQVRRRLVCSVLMVVFAGLLVGWFFLEHNVAQIEPTPLQKAQGEKVDLNPEQKESVRYFTLYVILVFAVLFAILFLAAFDIIATAKFGLRYQRRLAADHRTVLQKEAATLRKERNGPPA